MLYWNQWNRKIKNLLNAEKTERCNILLTNKLCAKTFFWNNLVKAKMLKVFFLNTEWHPALTARWSPRSRPIGSSLSALGTQTSSLGQHKTYTLIVNYCEFILIGLPDMNRFIHTPFIFNHYPKYVSIKSAIMQFWI